ncbi:MAG: hypothetical protein ABIH38_04580 [Patescibacteria group bacterium]
MRKALFLMMAMLLTFSLFAVPVSAAKPANAGAQTYSWHLSGDVMPVPPYGSKDIPGSDTASKLIVNQPNGNTVVTMTGVMNSLNPSTTYTVYLSKGYTPYTPVDVTGTYTWLVLGTYHHDLVITTQNPDGTFSGTGGYPAGSYPYTDPGQTAEVITGKVTGNQITFTSKYLGPYNPEYSATVSGAIAANGSMSGASPWEWHTTSGAATPASGSTGWPGLFTSTVQPFTFVTDEYGAGSWHVNLTDANLPAGDPGTKFAMSVWINEAGRTMLISDTFEITKG